MKNKNFLYYILLLVCGTVILSGHIDYQHSLSTGDHGLNLYVSEAVMRGDVPYRDFHWFYGPLMPYYYGLCFKAWGTKIMSVLAGKILLQLAGGLILFAGLSLFIAKPLSAAATLLFWANEYDSFYTYNHAGGIILSLVLLYFLFKYIKKPDQKYLYSGLIIVFFASLVKLNIGFSLLAATVVSARLSAYLKRKQNVVLSGKFLVNALIALPLIILGLHFILLYDLPSYEIKQCFQYFGNDAFTEIYPDLLGKLKILWGHMMARSFLNWIKTCFALVCALSMLVVPAILYKEKDDHEMKNNMIAALSTTAVLFLFQLHEFLLSGIYFRALWAYPFWLVLIFLCIGLATHHAPKTVRLCLYGLLVVVPLNQMYINYSFVNKFKKPTQYLYFDKAKVYTTNRPAWTITVAQTLEFIKKNMKKDELFFALPYDPLYYYLADKRSPTRQLVFFEFIDIPKEQELSVIQELEDNRVNWVVLSNRHHVISEPGLGTLGKDYCPVIGKYIRENFEVVAQYGEWVNEAGWAWDHGIKILKRK